MDNAVSCPNYDTGDASSYNRITAVQRGAPANPENCATKLRSRTQPTHKDLHQRTLQPDPTVRASARKHARDTIQADRQENATLPVLPARKPQHTTRQRACSFGHQNDTRAYYTQPQPTDTREPIERPRRPIRFNAETKRKAKRIKALVPPEKRRAADLRRQVCATRLLAQEFQEGSARVGTSCGHRRVHGRALPVPCQAKTRPPSRPSKVAADVIQQVTTRTEVEDTPDQPFLRQRLGEFFIVLRSLRCPFALESKARLAAV
jgi:hypothetical protein